MTTEEVIRKALKANGLTILAEGEGRTFVLREIAAVDAEDKAIVALSRSIENQLPLYEVGWKLEFDITAMGIAFANRDDLAVIGTTAAEVVNSLPALRKALRPESH